MKNEMETGKLGLSSGYPDPESRYHDGPQAETLKVLK